MTCRDNQLETKRNTRCELVFYQFGFWGCGFSSRLSTFLGPKRGHKPLVFCFFFRFRLVVFQHYTHTHVCALVTHCHHCHHHMPCRAAWSALLGWFQLWAVFGFPAVSRAPFNLFISGRRATELSAIWQHWPWPWTTTTTRTRNRTRTGTSNWI